ETGRKAGGLLLFSLCRRAVVAKEVVVSWKLPLAALALVPILAAVPLCPAEEPTKPKDMAVVDSKVEKKPLAASVDFRKELNLPYPSLGTLGSRIDSARKAPDPVSLAHSANELAVAEKVSGKKASLTSNQVLKEAQELAKLRRQEAELKALLYQT